MFMLKVAFIGVLFAGALARPQDLGPNDPGYMHDPHPIYQYKYQVSDDEKQTYIAHEENRDGSEVQGSYSYVDPLGSLITVTYTANEADGYNEERSVQEGFVTIRSSTTGSSTLIEPTVQVVETRTSQDDLVARIIAELTPFISSTVSSTLAGQQAAVATTRRVVAVAPQPAVSTTAGIFGDGGPNNVVVETPTYGFDYTFKK